MANKGGWSTHPVVFADVCEGNIKQRIRIISMAMLNEIVLRSPVDTGRFRGNHIISIGAPVLSESPAMDKNGGSTIRIGLQALSGLEPFTQVFIQNNLPYAQKLEDGFSKQAPAGIYEVSFNGVSQAYSS